MPGDVGLIARLVERVINLFINENELPEVLKRREGNRLSKAFQAAHRAWRLDPTDENKRKRDEARNALMRWSDQP